MHILILEADNVFRESLSHLLQEFGHSVDIAQNLAEAMIHCSPGDSDLIFLDPLSQSDMLSRIREYNSDIPVVVMSRNPSVESIIAALRQGAFDFLIKPIDDAELLLETIERARRSIEAANFKRNYSNRILKTFSELSYANESIRHQGYSIGTTEFYCNQYFEDILAIELARSQRCNHSFTIISVRLNYLMNYMSPETNVEFRNQIEAVAGFLHQRIRRTDALMRTDVNEFMIVLVETPKERARTVAENLCQGIATIIPEEICKTGQAEGEKSVDIGTAAYPLDGMECQVLMKKARQYA